MHSTEATRTCRVEKKRLFSFSMVDVKLVVPEHFLGLSQYKRERGLRQR